MHADTQETTKARLTRITLNGFKTIRELRDFEFGSLTVLIGPNGAGKSNFISFFRMLSWTLGARDKLQYYVSEQGGASNILHDGAAKTREVEAEITIDTPQGENQYGFRLVYAADDTFIYADERCRFTRAGSQGEANWKNLGAGHRESRLIQKAGEGGATEKVILNLIRRIKVYQFHNTSDTARIRAKWHKDEGRWLKEDAGNIAPFLFRLKEGDNKYYLRILETIRLAMPFIEDFELEAENGFLLLKWREKNTDRVFSVSQAADGMLRVIALVTLLLQPESDLPDLLILDEPELGLHPFAINIISGLIRSVSTKTQVILATQSLPLINCFEPQDIVVVERKGRDSSFERLEYEKLKAWLEDYSLAELYEKNILGGRP